MGLFSSKTEIVVDTFVSKVLDMEDFVDSTHKGLVSSIFEGVDLTDAVLNEYFNSIGMRAEQAYTYAKNQYTYGLPSGSIITNKLLAEDIDPVLERIEGSPVSLEYAYLGSLNYIHYGFKQLTEQYEYDALTNKVNNVPNNFDKDKFLHKLKIHFPASLKDTITPEAFSSLNGVSKYNEHLVTIEYVFDTDITEPYLEVVYKFVRGYWLGTEASDSGITYTYISFNINLPSLDDDVDYLQVKYYKNESVIYFIYKIGLGTYPEFDSLIEPKVETAGTYFPFIHFRLNNQSMDKDTSSEAYKTSNRLMKKLGLDYQMIMDAINENPDITDINQAVMTFAVPAKTDNQMELRYLFDYFSRHYYLQPQETNSLTNNLNTHLGSIISIRLLRIPTIQIVIKDSLYKQMLAYEGIYRKLVVGSIGEVDSYSFTLDHDTREYTEQSGESGPVTQTYQIPVHTYRKQVSPQIYEEIQVYDLQMRYSIANKTVIGDGEDLILLVPIDKSITENYSFPDREVLYSTSLHFVFNAMKKYKVKWYQQDIFQVFMIFIAIVIAINTGFFVEFSAAIAAGGTALVKFIIYKLVMALVMQELFTLVVKAVGEDIGMLLAVVAAAYALYEQFNSGDFFGKLVPSAKDMLTVANGLLSGVSGSIEDSFEDLAKANSVFQEEMERDLKLLDEAEDLLKNDNWLSPYILIDEKPKDYFARTIHSGNIGVLSLDAVSHYAETSLQLPKLSDTTFGEFAYV